MFPLVLMLLSAEPTAVDTVRVVVEVKIDDLWLQSELLTHFENELRGLHDVELVTSESQASADFNLHPDFTISVLGIPIKIGNAVRGHALSVAVRRKCDVNLLGPIYTLAFSDSAALSRDTSGHRRALAGMVELIYSCHRSPTHFVLVWPEGADRRLEVQRLVAEIDTHHFQVARTAITASSK